MARVLSVAIEQHAVAGTFTIARGAKHFVDVVVVVVTEDGYVGRGEATAIYYHGETVASVAGQIRDVAPMTEAGVERDVILCSMPRGAARNAVDAALWDLAAKQAGVPVWRMAGLPEPRPVTTAFTLSLAPPEDMEAAARAAAGKYPQLKLTLAGEGDTARVAAVRRGAPAARLIVDANESWTGRDIVAEAMALLPYGVELIEQPVKAGEDHLLDGLYSPIMLCADESCQDRADLPQCIGRYAAINIKLDKAGGLTGAVKLMRDARAVGLRVMVGCMLSTSLGIAPAALLAAEAEWVDLDGPLLLANDRPGGFHYEGGTLNPVDPAFWG